MPRVDKQKHVVLTLKQKVDICRHLEKGGFGKKSVGSELRETGGSAKLSVTDEALEEKSGWM